MHTYTCVYIYIYIYKDRGPAAREGHPAVEEPGGRVLVEEADVRGPAFGQDVVLEDQLCTRK